MRFFSPIRPLLKGWLLSFLGWGMVAFVLGEQLVSRTSLPWTEALKPAVRDWLPWAILTPLLFRFVGRIPLEWQRWKLALPAHLACCVATVALCHWWSESAAPGFGL